MSPMDGDGVVVDAGGKVDEVKVGGEASKWAMWFAQVVRCAILSVDAANRRHQRGCKATLCEFELLMFSLD